MIYTYGKIQLSLCWNKWTFQRLYIPLCYHVIIVYIPLYYHVIIVYIPLSYHVIIVYIPLCYHVIIVFTSSQHIYVYIIQRNMLRPLEVIIKLKNLIWNRNFEKCWMNWCMLSWVEFLFTY